jgi:hypothetical protein
LSGKFSANKLIGGKPIVEAGLNGGRVAAHNSDRSGGFSDFGDASQPWTATGEQSLLLTRIVATVNASFVLREGMFAGLILAPD